MTGKDIKKEGDDNNPVVILGVISVLAILIGFALQSYGSRSSTLLSSAPSNSGMATLGIILAVARGICLLAAIIIGVVRASSR